MVILRTAARFCFYKKKKKIIMYKGRRNLHMKAALQEDNLSFLDSQIANLPLLYLLKSRDALMRFYVH